MTARPRHNDTVLLPPRSKRPRRRKSSRWSTWTAFIGRWIKSKRDELSRPIDPTKLNARADEAYRKVVHALQQGGRPGSGKVVLVVSAVHGEGGSSVTKHLAGTMAQVKENRVLLVDANLRSPNQHLALGVQGSPGLVDVTADAQDIQTVALATSDAGFALLPVGQSQVDPIHSMREANLAGTLGELRKNFDWIVVDGPPATIYSEAAILSSLADATILVIRAESTRAEVAESAKRTIIESGGNLYGAILNRREYHIPEFVYDRL